MMPCVFRLGFTIVAVSLLTAVADGQEMIHPWDGSRTTPVHRIPVYGEDGEEVVPDAPYPLPLSARATCGPCHSYKIIQDGWHFNSTHAGIPAGRAGEPWVWVDEKTGTAIPLSYRDWDGVWDPDDLGMTTWRFTQVFGRHMPGGDMGEPEKETPDSRWQVSGKVEVNCLGCHSASHRQDQSEWAKQMARENFRWAATAANGLGEVGGMAVRVHDTWSIYDGPNPDDSQWAVRPYVEYDETRFDSRHYAIFDLRYPPPDDRCLYCHSVYPVEEERWTAPIDVHTEAGIGCSGCHRNSLDHRMTRGYEGEAGVTGSPEADAFTCEGCHSGDIELAGRFAAPRPKHRGLPPVHLERMTCTSCHSGVVPEDGGIQTVRMSRINRTGIHGRARWFTDQPRVVEPVFARDENGKIAPFRALWPSFWARIEDGRAVPIPPDEIEERIPGVLDAERQAGDILAALSTVPDATGEPVLFLGKKVYHRDIDGKVEGTPYEGSLDAAVWGWDFDGNYETLTLPPEIDEEGYVKAEIETPILAVFEALRSAHPHAGEPVLVFEKNLYRLGPEGWLEYEEYQGPPAETLAWGWLTEDGFGPLVPEFILRAALEIDGRIETLTEEQVTRGLRELARKFSGEEFAYVASGMMFRPGEEGELLAVSHPDAGPVLWPLAHEVRPEEQALGAEGCTECHRGNAPFFETVVAGTGPLAGKETGSVKFAGLLGMPGSAVAWGAWRERVLKSLTLPVSVGLVVLFLLHYVLFGSHMHRPTEQEREIPRHNALSRIGHYLLFLSVFAVAGTGFIFLLGTADPLGTGGQRLARNIHWIVGLGMAAGLVVIVLVWFRQMLWSPYDREWLKGMGGYLGGGHEPPAGKFNAGQKMFFWLTVIVGGVLVVTGIAMLSGIGWSSAWQAMIYTVHDAAGLLMIFFILLHVYLSVLVDPHSIRSVFGGRVHASWARERHSKWEAESGEGSGE